MSKGIETIRVTYDLATPLFCGGADPTVPEVRLSSFKGVLRWYWRAVVWQHTGIDRSTTERLALIWATEARLFGSPDVGQGKVSMRLCKAATARRSLPAGQVLKDAADAVVGDGARYLGYGVMTAFRSGGKPAGELTRGCVVPPLDVVIELRCRDLDDEQRGTLVRALEAVGLVGAMGGKSRKGYGSLVLRELVVNGEAAPVPRTIEELHKGIAGLHASPVGHKESEPCPGDRELPPYTALTKHARHVLLAGTSGMNALGLLDRVGRELVRYRSWGFARRDGRGNGVGTILGSLPSEQNFRDDHDLMKRVEHWSNGGSRGARPMAHPRRVVFGLPHNYGKASYQRVGPQAPLDRRASPLLIHIHRCDETPVAVLSFLPARFLPEGVALDVGSSKPISLVEPAALWAPINDVLDRFLQRPLPAGARRESFGKAMEVRP